MKAYDYILLSKVHNLSYSEMRCNNCTPEFLAHLESLGYDINQEWRIDDDDTKKDTTLSRHRSDSNFTDS